MAESYSNRQKTLWENEKLLVKSKSSFSHCTFKRVILRTGKNEGLFGNGLKCKNKGSGWEWQTKKCQQKCNQTVAASAGVSHLVNFIFIISSMTLNSIYSILIRINILDCLIVWHFTLFQHYFRCIRGPVHLFIMLFL